MRIEIWRGNTDHENAIRSLHSEIETLAKLHIQHGLHKTAGFSRQKRKIEALIEENEINLKQELDPLTLNLYRRYFG